MKTQNLSTKIYIIESQSDRDILHKRTEGKALSSGLELANINHEYYQVISKKTLNECFDLIIKDILTNKPKGVDAIIPYLHFSAHGNEDGIGLTNGDFIDWNMLRDKFDYLNSKIGMVKTDPNDPKSEISILHVCLSVCKGFYGKVIQGSLNESKYVVLIGPVEAVDWSDSLIAFMTFYHNIIYKGYKQKESVKRMNLAAGLNEIFQESLGYRIKYLD